MVKDPPLCRIALGNRRPLSLQENPDMTTEPVKLEET